MPSGCFVVLAIREQSILLSCYLLCIAVAFNAQKSQDNGNSKKSSTDWLLLVSNYQRDRQTDLKIEMVTHMSKYVILQSITFLVGV